jgi:hypothetical protein
MTVGIVVCLKLHAAAESRWAAVQNGDLYW